MCIYLKYVFKFPTKPSNPTNTVSSLLLLLFSVCLFAIGFSVVVCTLPYTLTVGRGNLGGFRRGVREGVSRVDSPALGSAEDYLTVPLLCIPEPVLRVRDG